MKAGWQKYPVGSAGSGEISLLPCSQTNPLTGTMAVENTATTKSYQGYDYALGLPNLQIDPIGGISTVTYDGLGSPTELRVEGDEVGPGRKSTSGVDRVGLLPELAADDSAGLSPHRFAAEGCAE